MASILITRPQASSETLAAELKRHGYECVIEPLLTIIPDIALRPAGNHQAVLVTSGNALDALGKSNIDISALLDLPCFCVGPRTAVKAAALGFRTTYAASGDGAVLAQLVAQKLPHKNRPLLHIAGNDVDSKAYDQLRIMAFTVVAWPVYAAIAAAKLTPQAIARLEEGKLDAVLVFSARTAVTLKSLLRQHGLEACCERLIAIGLSEAVTDVLKSLPWRKLIAAPVPTEDAAISCLKEALPVS